jgi:hypothetical protein
VALDDAVFTTIGLVAEASLGLLLIRSRARRDYPAFFIYICWCFFSDIFMMIFRIVPPKGILHIDYRHLFVIQLVLDAALMLAVLVELTWGVLRPIHKSLPKRSWIAIAILVVMAGGILWPIIGATMPTHLAGENLFLARLQETFGALRIVVFLGMAAFSQLLGIGFRHRELQIATGLGLYSIVSLAVPVIQTHVLPTQSLYTRLDYLPAISYVAAIGYWVYSFATREAVRREFTPQMQSFLLAIAGSARTTAVSLENPSARKDRREL